MAGKPAVLKIDILADAKGVGKGVSEAESGLNRLGGAAGKVGKAVGLGLAAAGAAAVGFGVSSVKAFVEAEQASARLDDALARFPATADRSRASFDALNSSLALKTKFDDDATASGQAVLAQFKLTGAQIQQLTPLLQDYAAKTGKDLPDAANTLGKALLGKGKALADVGIKFKDAGSVGKNFDQIMGGLRTQVGGFAEREGKTAAGSLAILKNRFGEVQENVGARLLPILTKMVAFASTTLLPMFSRASDALSKSLSPAFSQLGEFVRSKVLPAATIMAGYFTTSVLPALRAVGSFITANLVPAFTAVASFILTRVVPAATQLAVPVLGALRSGLATVGTAINGNRTQLAAIGGAIQSVIGVALKLAPVVGGTLAVAFRVVATAISVVVKILGAVVRAAEKAADAIRAVAKVASKVGSVVGGLNPFGGQVPLFGAGVPLVSGGPHLAAPTGLTTAALGDFTSGTLSSLRATAAVMVVDRRSFPTHVTITGAVDPVGIARQLEQVLADQARRLGRAPTLTGALG